MNINPVLFVRRVIACRLLADVIFDGVADCVPPDGIGAKWFAINLARHILSKAENTLPGECLRPIYRRIIERRLSKRIADNVTKHRAATESSRRERMRIVEDLNRSEFQHGNKEPRT